MLLGKLNIQYAGKLVCCLGYAGFVTSLANFLAICVL